MDALQTQIKAGRLKVIDPDGNVHVLAGVADGPQASIKITDRKIVYFFSAADAFTDHVAEFHNFTSNVCPPF